VLFLEWFQSLKLIQEDGSFIVPCFIIVYFYAYIRAVHGSKGSLLVLQFAAPAEDVSPELQRVGSEGAIQVQAVEHGNRGL
jgi:hypothetical protein